MTDVDPVEAGLAKLGEGYVPEPPSTNGKHAHDAPIVFGDACRLPDDVWGAVTVGPLGDRLRHIKRAAQSRQRCATAVANVVLARVAAAIPHTIKLDDTVGSEQPLCMLTFITGPPGTGKGDAVSIGSDLIPVNATPLLIEGVNDHLPPGSGQGLIDVMFDMVEEPKPSGNGTVKVKRQVRNNAFFQLDEGEAMTSLAGQSSSIVMETIRTIWSGKTVGQFNVEIERRRVLPGGTYTYGLVGGIQPVKAATILNDDEGGTPQRFVWAPSVDPNIPAERELWPGPLDWAPPDATKLDTVSVAGPQGWLRHYLTQPPEIQADIRAHDLAVQRGELTLGLLDAHAMNMRRRVAGLLALLDDSLHVNAQHWELAKLWMAASDATRAVVITANLTAMAKLAEQKRTASARTRVAEVDAVELRHTIDQARKIAVKVHAEPERWTVAELRRALSKRGREYLDDALAHALAEHWVEIIDEEGQGAAKRSLRPGVKKP